MATSAVSSVIQYLGPLLAHEVELLKGVRKEMDIIKSELEYIRSFLKDAESKADVGKEGEKIWVKDVRGVAYRIEDVIDEYILLHLAKQQPRRCGFIIRYFRKVTHSITRLKQRHEIASQIQDIKTTINELIDINSVLLTQNKAAAPKTTIGMTLDWLPFTLKKTKLLAWNMPQIN
ncbi:unnamed protein product [Camellia sinensis]|uniref:Disease resistance N-terminal domain-containing protein n=1 Tax=Camellia sinensis var. sinensis TaxID=542762 RepID=A0A4S4EP93_CAMSN|nr:hypothetical protein TEA_028857 [Camellia sinensis var. sinensis]